MVGNNPINDFDVLGLGFWSVFEDAVRTTAGAFTVAAGVAVGVSVGWTGVGAVGAAALITIGADQMVTGAASLASQAFGGDQIQTTLIQHTYRTTTRAVLGDGTTVEQTLDVIYFGAEVTSTCYTGFASVKAIIVARRARTVRPLLDTTRVGPYPPARQYVVTEAGEMNLVVESFVSFTDKARATTTTITETIDLTNSVINTFIVDVGDDGGGDLRLPPRE
jgi:hypothetical protein